ncbi:uncharacterized protein LOC118756707 [Rhagoletis pomonella]|uniref:uncharacterized protein LOC118756707 n=1 Tax=Rhagoletis pomonella TaxID=28610 RepID=UPI00178595E7|nr:uncharacterized protein LOC118756707 [Rhagoletis pomonella]
MADTRRELRELDCSNLSLEWKNWKREFLVYMIAKDKNLQPESTKIATFLWLIGTKGANIYNTLFPNDGSHSLLGTFTAQRMIPATDTEAEHGVTEIKQRSLEEVLQAFDNHCLPQKNVTMESYKFNNMSQKERQPFNEFLTELRVQLERCEYNCICGASYENRMLRDRIITGVCDRKLQLKLLDRRDENLERVVEMCKTFESVNANKDILASKQSISAVASIASKEKDEVNAINVTNRRFCFNCGGDWNSDHKSKCPAREFMCSCGKKGHFRRMCRKKANKSEAGKQESKPNGRQRVDTVR